MATDGTISDSAFIYHGPLSARMACHMGDYPSSALCNILGDQPLFYIDYVDAEEADFVDPMALLEGEDARQFYPENLEQLRRRMARLEGASQHIDASVRENPADAFAAACARLGASAAPESADRIAALLSQSRLAAGMLDDAKARGLKIVMNPQVDASAYDRDQICIHINPRLDAPIAVVAAARALRQAWLHLSGAAIHPLHFAPEEAVLLNRIQHADCAVAMLRTAWELNLSGDRAAWNRILTGSGYDMAVGFAREAIADFRALNNGHAAHAAFERWFFSGRCKDVDRRLIQTMLADHHGLVFENPQVSKMVTGDIIARTGELPVGKNYLTGLIEAILADPLFTEVRDRSNANFLWFIKFERSFRASEGTVEQSLQGVPMPAGSIPAASKEQEEHASAEVITFKGPHRQGKPARKGAGNGADVATVYYIDHFLSLSNR